MVMTTSKLQYVPADKRKFRYLNLGSSSVKIKCDYHRTDNRIVGSLVMLNAFGPTETSAKTNLIQIIGQYHYRHAWGFHKTGEIYVDYIPNQYEATTTIAFFSKKPGLIEKIKAENISDLFWNLVEIQVIRPVKD